MHDYVEAKNKLMHKYFIIFSFSFILLFVFACSSNSAKVIGEYKDIDKLGGDFIHNEITAYDIGINKDGKPIFKIRMLLLSKQKKILQKVLNKQKMSLN